MLFNHRLYPFIILLFPSCANPKEQFQEHQVIDYSYNNVLGQGTAFSVKITDSDTLYLYQHFSQGDWLPDSTTYYAVMGKEDKLELNRLIDILRETKLDTAALYDYTADSDAMDICLTKENIDREFYATGDNIGVMYRNFNHWLENFQKDTKFVPIDTLIHFKSGHGVIYPDRILNFNLENDSL